LQSYKSREKRLLEALNNTTSSFFQRPASSLPAPFVPEVMPMGKDRREALQILRNVNTSIIAVSLQNFFRGTHETPLLRKAKRSGLHGFFDFSGEILLTTDVSNRLCDRFIEYPNYFRSIVEKLGPDFLTTFDTYTYSNIPACISRIKMLEAMLSSYRLSDLNCKIIGLSLGATPDQMHDYVGMLMKLGCKIVAHPVYEFRRTGDTYPIRWRIFLSRKLNVKVLLLSCSPGRSAIRRVYADYYSSWSWFSSVSSKDRNAYEKRKAKLLRMIELGKKYSKQTCL
jgi:hypothetical protein